ncbi:MAG TPA: RDD family protein [Verrucomicrobiae bacterium]|nr:RDD family protein [Verrucomicrobiae bacterium]
MRRFFPYLLGLLLIGVSPAQVQQPEIAEPESKPAEDISIEAPKKDVVEDEWGEAVVKDNKVRHRNRPREPRRHRPPTEPHIRTDFTVKKGDTSGEIVIIDGELRVEGTVDGNIVAIASKAFIDGVVKGTVVVVPGPVTFGPNAEIAEETVVVGEFQRDPDAKFGRHFQAVPIPNLVPIITGAKDFVFEGVIMMRPLPPSVRWVWVFHGAMFLVLIGMTLLFPKPVEVGAKAISDRPVVSIFSGFLTAILFIPVLLLLVVTVVGIIAVPFAIAGICIAALFGKASVLEFIGQQIGRNLRVQLFESPLIALLIGALILALFYMVPVLGMLIWCVATLLGLGAIMVATASTLNTQPSEPTPAGPAPLGAPATPIGAPPLTEPAPPVSAAVPTAAPVLLKRAGFWKRTFAAFLDWVLLGIPIILSHVFAPGLFPLVLIAYFVTMWTWKGTSVGKICLGLKIVRTDGTPIDFAVALVRSLAACFSFMVFLLGFFWAGWDKEKQSWHDKIAGTVVVQVPKGVSLL